MAYFDNAATTYPKPECVYSYMDEFYRHNGVNAGRGNYGLAQTAGSLISDTRKRIQEKEYKNCCIAQQNRLYLSRQQQYQLIL